MKSLCFHFMEVVKSNMEEDYLFQFSDEPDYVEELDIMKSRGFLPYVTYAYQIK